MGKLHKDLLKFGMIDLKELCFANLLIIHKAIWSKICEVKALYMSIFNRGVFKNWRSVFSSYPKVFKAQV